ncbi:MAG: hypothetical protein WC796_05275 [Candidatus Pacearchaeota archaeon]|jgi:hypothetical protein
MTKNSWEKVGSWAFLIGVILALVLGIYTGVTGAALTSYWILILVIIGLIVGFLNITGKETTPFLLSGVVLIIASALGGGVFARAEGAVLGINLGLVIGNILGTLMAIFVPATIIVAIKNVFALAKDK